MKESLRYKIAKTLGVIFLVVLCSLLVYKALNQGIYSSRLGINVAVVGEDSVGMLLLRPEEDVVGWITFPSNLKVKIFNSSARYPINSLWDYGVQERNPYEVVEKTVGMAMGVTVAKTIKIEGEPSVEGVLAGLHKINLRTNLSLRDRFLIRKFLATTATSKKVLEMEIPVNIFDKLVEPDGKEFLSFNSVSSLWTKNKFVLESILGENVDLVVNNLSGQLGLGTQVAKQLESAGVRVVEVKSDPEVGVSGSGCLFSIFGKYPYTESFLVDQVRCTKIDSIGEENEKGITVWIK